MITDWYGTTVRFLEFIIFVEDVVKYGSSCAGTNLLRTVFADALRERFCPFAGALCGGLVFVDSIEFNLRNGSFSLALRFTAVAMSLFGRSSSPSLSSPSGVR